jgi:arabinan endo-1,5-alpha-L-arabinosidase
VDDLQRRNWKERMDFRRELDPLAPYQPPRMSLEAAAEHVGPDGSPNGFVKLTSSAIGPTRVTELGREVPAGPPGYPRGGSMTVGPPGDTTWLRLVRRGGATESRLTAYTSQDGAHWVRGGTWTMRDSGVETRIGLVAMGGAGFTARFDDVRVWALAR